MAKRFPKSLRKFVRREKARLRREIPDRTKAEEEIKKIVSGLTSIHRAE